MSGDESRRLPGDIAINLNAWLYFKKDSPSRTVTCIALLLVVLSFAGYLRRLSCYCTVL